MLIYLHASALPVASVDNADTERITPSKKLSFMMIAISCMRML